MAHAAGPRCRRGGCGRRCARQRWGRAQSKSRRQIPSACLAKPAREQACRNRRKLANGTLGDAMTCRRARADYCPGRRSSRWQVPGRACRVPRAPARPSARACSSGLLAIPTSCRFSGGEDEACYASGTRRSDEWRRLCHAQSHVNSRNPHDGHRLFIRRNGSRSGSTAGLIDAPGIFVGRLRLWSIVRRCREHGATAEITGNRRMKPTRNKSLLRSVCQIAVVAPRGVLSCGSALGRG